MGLLHDARHSGLGVWDLRGGWDTLQYIAVNLEAKALRRCNCTAIVIRAYPMEDTLEISIREANIERAPASPCMRYYSSPFPTR